MIHINNRSDFSIVWKMPNGDILPTFTYTLSFSTRGGLRYTVKSNDASRFIPKPDADGQVRSAVIVFDFSNRPHLPSGRLSFTMKAEIPNNMYPDGYQDITEPHPTNVELWDGATDYKDAVEIELVLPYIKGDKGDAGEGVPAGGRTGQVLKKRSDDDYDTAWGEDEGITDIAPNAVGTTEIADKAVTPEKLSADVIANIEGRATVGQFEDAMRNADDALGEAREAKAGVQSNANLIAAMEERINDANATASAANATAADALKVANNEVTERDKEIDRLYQEVLTRDSEIYAKITDVQTGLNERIDDVEDSESLRYDIAQELMPSQQEQVFANLGLKVVYIAASEFGTTLTEERANEILHADICIATYSGHQYAFFYSGRAQTGLTYFTTLQSNENVLRFTLSDTFVLNATVIAKYVAGGGLRYDIAQTLTSAQQQQARTNIAAMANTPSGDPMHYMYEIAGAQWIPYADISTDGLESWQINTLDRAQAQADGGVWWHNGIFVTVEQNRINYVSTVGDYPANQPTYDYYLKNTPATTNYKQSIALTNSKSAVEAIRVSNTLRTVLLPNMKVTNIGYAINNCPQLRRIIGDIDVSAISSFSHAFEGCGNLRDISLNGLNASLDLSGVPNLSMTSIAYAVTNAGTTTLTIALAPAVYAAAVADVDVQAALAAKPNVTLADAGAAA